MSDEDWEPIYHCLSKSHGVDSQRTFFGILLAMFTFVGICFLAILLLILYSLGSKAHFLTYKLMISLTASQLVFLFAVCITMIPCTFTKCLFYSDTAMISMAWMNTLGYYVSICTNGLIAVERISIFHFISFHQLIEIHYWIVVASAWLFGVFITAVTTAMGCFKRLCKAYRCFLSFRVCTSYLSLTSSTVFSLWILTSCR